MLFFDGAGTVGSGETALEAACAGCHRCLYSAYEGSIGGSSSVECIVCNTMVIYNLSRCDNDAAICQFCSCWCSCCAFGSCFCSRCLRGCCAVEVVDVVGAVLCGASRNMLVCCVCCFVARTVLMSL